MKVGALLPNLDFLPEVGHWRAQEAVEGCLGSLCSGTGGLAQPLLAVSGGRPVGGSGHSSISMWSTPATATPAVIHGTSLGGQPRYSESGAEATASSEIQPHCQVDLYETGPHQRHTPRRIIAPTTSSATAPTISPPAILVNDAWRAAGQAELIYGSILSRFEGFRPRCSTTKRAQLPATCSRTSAAGMVPSCAGRRVVGVCCPAQSHAFQATGNGFESSHRQSAPPEWSFDCSLMPLKHGPFAELKLRPSPDSRRWIDRAGSTISEFSPVSGQADPAIGGGWGIWHGFLSPTSRTLLDAQARPDLLLGRIVAQPTGKSR